jgi:spoIIIJ-associated protein
MSTTPEDHSNLVLEHLTDIITRLGLTNITVEVRYDPENDIYLGLLQSENPALLIGFHGEALSSIQLILGQHIHAALGQWLNISLNVNDYRERRETILKNLAENAVSKVLATGNPYSLPPMPANERRIVHLYLSEHPQITTASQGVGRSRCIVISPKAS